MLAYHNDQAIKDKYISRVRAHRAADQLIQGIGWSDGKGCAIGCTLEVYDHSRYPIELGIPPQLAYLEDRLFEIQTREDAMAWPERFLGAIRPGADLAQVWPQWAVWMLEDPAHGAIRHAAGYPDCESAIRRVAELWRPSGPPQRFREAAWAAAVAAWAAAWAATWAARAATKTAKTAEAAEAAARAATWAARAATWAARAADAAEAAARAAEAAESAEAAEAAAWTKAACAKLIELLEAA